MYPITRNGSKGCGARGHSIWLSALAAMIVGLGATPAPAQLLLTQKLTASDAGETDWFGSSISVSGNTMLLGADNYDGAAGTNTGAVYVFRFNGSEWIETQMLVASDSEPGEFFGRSVSLNGDLAVVNAVDGCPVQYYCGSAYVFRFNGTSWIEEQKLTASDPQDGDAFGFSASISGDTVVLGAPGDFCEAGDSCGSAYVFRFNGTNWVEEQRLTAFERTVGAGFGGRVAVSGETVLVAAQSEHCMGDPDPYHRCGSAYVFRYDGTRWVEEQRLVSLDLMPDDTFGFSVSLRGDTAAIGAYHADCDASTLNCGSAYIFRRSGGSWVQEQKLAASDRARADQFGRSISLNGDTVVVGADGTNCAAGADCGAAYVYRFDGTNWIDEQKLTIPDAVEYDWLGNAVSLSGNTVIVAARADDDACPTPGPGQYCESGSVFVFRPSAATTGITVPAVSTWGLAALTMLLLAAGAIAIRRTTRSPVSVGRA